MVSSESVSIIVPLSSQEDIWTFLYPFNLEVWIFSLISIPIFTIASGLTDYFGNGSVDWITVLGFVFRNVLSESFQSYHRFIKRLSDKKQYTKLMLSVVWIWSCFILVKSYSGNLTAFITKPKLVMQFEMPEDFLNQDDMTLVVSDETAITEMLMQSPPKSTMGMLFDETKRMTWNKHWPSSCFNNSTQYTKRHASICDVTSIMSLLSDDFSQSGKCNWYTTKTTFFHVPMVMAFQVGKFSTVASYTPILIPILFFRRKAHTLMMPMN